MQVVDFDYSGGVDVSQAYMVGPEGTETPYQVLSNGKIAVQTGLAAGTQRTWRLMGGRAPAQSGSGLQLTAQSGYYEISNGLTGVRIMRPGATPDKRLAPIQGIQLRDGSWTATGPNYIYRYENWNGTPNPGTLPALTVASTLVESGPLKVVVQVAYTYDRPGLYYGNTLLIAGGPGSYKSTITVEAGQPSVQILEETDMDLQYYLNAFAAVQPDTGRYRGHIADNAQEGVDSKGNVYDGSPLLMDAFRQIPYTTSFPQSPFFRQVATWDPWARNTGWYWMLYKAAAGAGAPVLGVYSGQASQALGLNGSGAGVYAAARDMNGQQAAGLSFRASRRSADDVVSPKVRMFWAIFTGTKGNDLANPLQVQNIGLQMNLHGGINLNKVYRYPATFADPPGGYSSLYLPGATVNQIVQRVRTDQSYYDWLYSADPTARPLLDMWRDTTGKLAVQQVATITNYAHDLLDILVNKNGIYDFDNQYWMGGLAMSRLAPFVNDMLARNVVAGPDRDRMKAAAVLFGNILWDDDFAPLQDGTQLNLGPDNNPIQQVQYRNLYTLMLGSTPAMSARVPGVQASAAANLQQVINSNGAHISSPHYVEASMGPLLSTMQQLKLVGVDLYRNEPRTAKFSNFYLDLLTPPEPRFGGIRKLVSLGDGSTESSELFGQLGTAFAGIDSTLSGRLMRAWDESGKMHSGFQGTTVLKIDDTLPTADLNLTSNTYPGYYSVLRNAAGTPNESAVWFVNGSFYFDHRHQDMGSAVIYALGAPLSIDWGSTYSPRVAGAYMHNVVLPVKILGRAWDADNVSLETPDNPWRSRNQASLDAFDFAARTEATFYGPGGDQWMREITMVYGDAAHPVISLRDTFKGPHLNEMKVSTFHFLAKPPTGTPRGVIIPQLRIFDGVRRHDLPSDGDTLSVGPGISRFRFTGQWSIDWDAYVISDKVQQAALGNWAHTWHPDREADEFERINHQPFRERQTSLRVRGQGAFHTLVVPFRKSESAPNVQMAENGNVVISRPGQETTIGADHVCFKGHRRTVLAVLGNDAVVWQGIRVSGGPAEIVIEGDQATITGRGARGLRRIELPGVWIVSSTGAQAGNGWITFMHKGDEASRIRLKRAPGPL